MPSAPAGGARAPTPRRRAKSSSPARRSSPRAARGSAPARLGGSVNPVIRRAFSASPGVRNWSPPRARGGSAPRARRSPPRGPGRLAKGLTGFLALQAALMGRKVNGPYVGASGKTLALYPLGSSAAPYNLGPVHTIGRKHQLNKFPVVERTRLRRPRTCGRKACLGGQPNSGLYDPNMTWVKLNGSRMPRKFGEGAFTNFPMPVISAANVLKFEAQGYQFPKQVLKQAQAGLPIIGNYKLSNKTLAALAAKDPRMLPAIFEATRPLPSRFNRTNQLALPAGVQRKLQALENRARSMAVTGTAKAAAFPYKVAKKARNVTGYVAESVGRGASSVASAARYASSLPGRGKRALGRFVSAQGRRLPN
jgi:hypothetical protein